MLVQYQYEAPGASLIEFLVVDVPDWLIHQICYANTVRGVKIPVYTPSYASHQPFGCVKADTIKGSLSENDYRFYEGNRSNYRPNEGRCRWCGAWMAVTKLTREAHKNKGNCLELLRTVYDFAKKSSKPACFVCGMDTYASRWGIPLCLTGDCVFRWKFEFWNSHKPFLKWVAKTREAGRFGVVQDSKGANEIPKFSYTL